MIAAEQQALVFYQVAQVIRGVSRRVERPQRDGIDSHQIAFMQRTRWREATVVSAVREGQLTQYLRTGGSRKCHRSGRMIAVRVRDEHGFDRTTRDRENPLDVSLIVRTRIDHEIAQPTKQVRIRAGTGHEPGIVGDEPLHIRRNDIELTGLEHKHLGENE